MYLWMGVWAVLTNVINAGIEHIDLNYTNSKASYDELFQDALRAYNNDDHHEAVIYMERAIADYRHILEVKAHCWIRCQANYKKLQSSDMNILDGQLNLLHYSIKIKSCVELCQELFVGRRGRVDRSLTQQFQDRTPYSYLQFSYFKIGEFEKALAAAYTHFELHPDNTMMKDNINWMLKKLQKDEKSLKSLHEFPHIADYRKGEHAYTQKNYTQCVHAFEDSLTLFFKETEKCNAVCETEHERSQGSYSTTLFNHFKAIIECRQKCHKDLTRMSGKTSMVHFVPYYFHYLQYCYFQTGNFLEAAIAAESYLLLIPDDPIMMANLAYYKKQPVLWKKKIEPRNKISVYFKQFAMELSLLQVANGYASGFSGIRDNEELKKDEEQLDAVFNAIKDDIKMDHPANGEHDRDKISHHLRKKGYRDQGRWKESAAVNKSILLMEEDKLNGTDRVAFDNVATGAECKQLMNLVQILTKDDTVKLINKRLQQIKHLSNAVNITHKLARSGDGYEHNHDDAAHPFTNKEVFKGITVQGAVDGIEAGQVSISDVDLYVQLSERARLLTQEYFDLPIRLNFAFTHLVCRHALTDAITDEEHLSHPIHSDNCVLDGDGVGTCPKRPPAYTWRDYSALLYLNDDFEGGDFIFANYKREIEARLRPKCGRLVSFRSIGVQNLHGVLGVRNGTRCALPIWFTLSDKSEDGREKAEIMLQKIKSKFQSSNEKLEL